MPDDDYYRIVREPECERLTGLERTTRWRMERNGQFPKRRKISAQSVGWYYGEILEWQQARESVAA